MTEGPPSGTELGRLARAVGHGPDFQILIVEAVADEARRMAREAIDHAAEERGFRVAEVCWDPAADADGLEQLIIAAVTDADLIHLSGAPNWLTSQRWQGLNIRRDRLAESARARLVWWLHPRNVAEMATQAPDLWAWRGGVYSFLDVASPSVSPLTSFDFPHEAQVNRADPEPRRNRIREIRSWLEGTPQPELVYEVAREWGDLALSLGEFDEARHAYQDIALPAARLHHTAQEALTIKQALATVATEAGDFDGAIEILKDATEESGRLLGADHPDTLRSRNNLASAYQDAGRLNDAIPLFEETLTTEEQLFGPDHPDTLITRNNLASAYRAAGRLNDAIPLHEENFKARTQLLGPNHPHTLTSSNNLASAYRAASRLNDAIPLHEENLKALTQILGPNHPHTLTSRNNLASAYYAAGRINDAIPLFEENLTAQTQLLGPDHPDTLRSRHNLAMAYEAAGKPFRPEEQPGASA